jgi:hypothetical protein
LLYFKKTPIKTDILAITRWAINPIMAILAHLKMAIIMVVMGVFLKCSKNADHWPKRFLKVCM